MQIQVYSLPDLSLWLAPKGDWNLRLEWYPLSGEPLPSDEFPVAGCAENNDILELTLQAFQMSHSRMCYISIFKPSSADSLVPVLMISKSKILRNSRLFEEI